MDLLPPLRDDLRLHPGPRQAGGWPSWTIQDPVRQKFFQLGWLEFECLVRWQDIEPEKLARRVSRETALDASEADVTDLREFLIRNELIAPGSIESRALAKRRATQNKGLVSRLLHGYLFFRIPLLRPDRALSALEPLSRVFFSRGFWWLIGTLALLGLFLVSRQWEVFLNTFTHFGSWQGATAFALTLALVKIVHEFGHAFAAKRYGLRVGSMGVAFLVMWPVLYTDATDAWRLTDRRHRLVIGSAGMAVELLLAVLATLAWVVLPEGPWRSTAFLVATITWVGTLLINLNPFLRFDGYYLLSDALGIENLHARSFALGRWWMRKALLGLNDPAPEHFTPGRRRGLILFAYATWAYRVVLFLGIALLVYQFAFKLLGIFLAAVEIIWFLARPFATEIRVWFARRADIGINPRVLLSGLMLLTLFALLFLPWRTDSHLPAIHGAATDHAVFAGVDGRLNTLRVKSGTKVREGDVLLELISPALEQELTVAMRAAEAVREELRRALASRDKLDSVAPLQQAMGRELTRIDGIRSRMDRLRVRAPTDGTVVDIHPALRPGLWLNGSTQILRLLDTRGSRVEAYVPEDELAALRESLSVDRFATFIPEDPDAARHEVHFSHLDSTPPRALEHAELASIHGGSLTVKEENGELHLLETVYRARFGSASELETVSRQRRGVLVVPQAPSSLADRVSRVVQRAWIRESSF